VAILPGNCPFCSGIVEVSAFFCRDCGARVEGRFAPNRLAALDGEQAEFVLAFVRARGNIKELERALGVSYPTVRARLNAVIRALGFGGAGGASAAPAARERRIEVLDAVGRGELDAGAAAAELEKL